MNLNFTRFLLLLILINFLILVLMDNQNFLTVHNNCLNTFSNINAEKLEKKVTKKIKKLKKKIFRKLKKKKIVPVPVPLPLKGEVKVHHYHHYPTAWSPDWSGGGGWNVGNNRCCGTSSKSASIANVLDLFSNMWRK